VSVRVAEALGWTDTRPPLLVAGEWRGRPPAYLGLGSEVVDIPRYDEPNRGAHQAVAHLILLLAGAGKLPKPE
jgi:hypothetical protein